MAKKAEVEAKKAAEVAKQKALQEDKEWSKGANTKKLSREQEAAEKADEAARKKREKAELLAAEEAATGGGGGAKKAAGGAAAKKKGKKKDDLAMLEDALVSAADKKVKKQKAELQAKMEKEAAAARAKEAESASAAPLDPLLANTEKMIGVIDDEEMGRKANVARMQDEGASGIDAALGALGVSSPTTNAAGQPVTSAKALYKEFETRMLPIVKEESPGLRLTQYKEKIWNLWKKSPENPANMIAQSTEHP